MADISERLGLKLPVGTDTVNRTDYRENLEKIDTGAALKADTDAHAADKNNPHVVTAAQAGAAPASHAGAGGAAHAAATAAAAGFMSVVDKAKLDGIAAAVSSGVTDISTSSAEYVDMPDMAVTVTFAAGKAFIEFNGAVRDSSGYHYIALLVDGEIVKATPKCNHTMTNYGELAASAVAHTLSTVINLAAGEHTVKVQWKVAGGSAYQDGAVSQRDLIVVGGLG